MINFEEEIIELLIQSNIKKDLIKLEVPDPLLGDYAFPCFQLSKEFKKNPQIIAQELSEKLINLKDSKSNIEKIEFKGPYINFFINKEIKAKNVIKSILDDSFFTYKKINQNIMVEYCQVNTHKAFHVGHLRGTLIGSSLVNLFRYCGYNVISANYQGDTGTHVAKSLWYLTNYSKDDFPKKRKGIWLGKIYQKANELYSTDDKDLKEKYKKEVSEILQRLENRELELTNLWKQTRQYSLDDFEEIYNLLSVKFDEYFFEGNMEEKGKEIVKELLNKKIAYYDDNAVIINLKEHNLGNYILLKSDGTALYSTKDLALAKIKFEDFKIHHSLYVVGSEQKYHFQQLFKTLEIMGFENAKNCKHIPFDLVNLEGGKISSREGELILAIDLIEEIINKAEIEVKERGNVENVEEVAKKIAISAIKFGFLNYDNNKSIIFNMNKALDFEGETGPYIQYVYARISRILEKSNFKEDLINNLENKDLLIENIIISNEYENKLISNLMKFPEVIKYSVENYKIHNLARYLIELSQTFNEFYHQCPILNESDEIKNSRLILIISVKKVISKGLKILGISTIEKM
jgi:arginyl-tRNA synthetase